MSLIQTQLQIGFIGLLVTGLSTAVSAQETGQW